MANNEVRHYKRAFQKGYDVEDPNESPRVDLTVAQKSWLVRAWLHFFGRIPNTIPTYNEKQGFRHQKGQDTQWHHITPIGVANRVLEEPYNEPRNICPVDARNHIGRKAEEDDFVIHEDTQQALKEYGEWSKNGHKRPNPFEKMGDERRKATRRGDIYHSADYDDHLREVAEQVVDKYTADYPDDKWPRKGKR